jgi:hypothetical protein
MYVTDQTGKRIKCPHPHEFWTVAEVLRAEATRTEELIEQRTGFNSYCLCLDCLANLEIDLERDARVCPSCKSTHIASLREMVGGTCPKCKEGTIQEIETGWWS